MATNLAGLLGGLGQQGGIDFNTAMSDPRVAFGLGLLSTKTPQEGIAQGIGLLSQQSTLKRQQMLDELDKKYKEAQIAHLNDPDSPFAKLLADRAKTAEGSPERALYDAQVTKENTVTSFGYPMPVIGPDGNPTFAARNDVIKGGYKPIPAASSVTKPPTGYAFGPSDESGSQTLVPIAGGPADPSTKPLNEYQGKSNLFGNRMEDAEAIISDKGASVGTDPVQRAKIGTPLIGNYLASSDMQQEDQAERNFVNATLRQESGAAINQSEFDNAIKQYFPRPGDGPEVLAQKPANRATAIKAMQEATGPSYKSRKAASAGSSSSIGGTAPASQPTEADINHTAQKYGMTPAQVRQQLGIGQ